MIPSKNLTHPELTKVETENCQSFKIHKKYKNYLNLANENKFLYLELKQKALTNNSESLKLYIFQIKSDALEYWNLSQKYLNEYNNFELSRKYKNH